MRLLHDPIVTQASSPDRFRTLTYRRRPGADLWHYRPECSGWPAEAYHEQRETPSVYPYCVECDDQTTAAYVSGGDRER